MGHSKAFRTAVLSWPPFHSAVVEKRWSWRATKLKDPPFSYYPNLFLWSMCLVSFHYGLDFFLYVLSLLSNLIKELGFEYNLNQCHFFIIVRLKKQNEKIMIKVLKVYLNIKRKHLYHPWNIAGKSCVFCYKGLLLYTPVQ